MSDGPKAFREDYFAIFGNKNPVSKLFELGPTYVVKWLGIKCRLPD